MFVADSRSEILVYNEYRVQVQCAMTPSICRMEHSSLHKMCQAAAKINACAPNIELAAWIVQLPLWELYNPGRSGRQTVQLYETPLTGGEASKTHLCAPRSAA